MMKSIMYFFQILLKAIREIIVSSLWSHVRRKACALIPEWWNHGFRTVRKSMFPLENPVLWEVVGIFSRDPPDY